MCVRERERDREREKGQGPSLRERGGMHRCQGDGVREGEKMCATDSAVKE